MLHLNPLSLIFKLINVCISFVILSARSSSGTIICWCSYEYNIYTIKPHSDDARNCIWVKQTIAYILQIIAGQWIQLIEIACKFLHCLNEALVYCFRCVFLFSVFFLILLWIRLSKLNEYKMSVFICYEIIVPAIDSRLRLMEFVSPLDTLLVRYSKKVELNNVSNPH